MLATLLTLLPLAHATDFHACDCGPAAEAGCVAGDDANAGTDPDAPFQTLTRARQAFGGELQAGDRLLFCQGGDFAADGGAWVNDRCTSASPCTVSAYAPSWGGAASPRISSAGLTAFDLSNGGDAMSEEGYRIEALDVRCVGCETTGGVGVFLFNDVDHVTLRDLRLEGFGIGVQLAGSNPCLSADPDCDGQSSDLLLERVTVHGSHVIGFLGGSDRTAIVDSTFTENGTESVFHHNVYLAGSTGPTQGMVVSGNTLHRSAWRANGRCQGTSLVVHGEHQDLEITDNLVMEDPGEAEEGCWGIGIDAAYTDAERFERVRVARNTVLDVGNVGIGLSSCADCVVENNVVSSAQAFSTTAVLAPNRPLDGGDAELSSLVVRNNSAWLASGGVGVSLPEQVDQHVVVSNAIQLGASGSCFGGVSDPGAYAAFSHNVCDAAGGSWFEGVGDLGAWQATGLGEGSQATAPDFADPAAGVWRSGAPDGPLVDAGHPDRSATDDRDGIARDGAPDVGAAEWRVQDDTGPGGDDTGPGGDGGGAGGGTGGGSGGGPATPSDPGTSAAAAAGEQGGCGCGGGAPAGGGAAMALALLAVGRRRRGA
jgi:hypothetical protein